MHALFWENRHRGVSTIANNQIRVSVAEPKIQSKSYCLASYYIKTQYYKLTL